MDRVEEDIVICFICDDRLMYGEQYREDEGNVLCSINCNNEYLDFNNLTLNNKKEIER